MGRPELAPQCFGTEKPRTVAGAFSLRPSTFYSIASSSMAQKRSPAGARPLLGYNRIKLLLSRALLAWLIVLTALLATLTGLAAANCERVTGAMSAIGNERTSGAPRSMSASLIGRLGSSAFRLTTTGFDAARRLVLLFGIGAKALP